MVTGLGSLIQAPKTNFKKKKVRNLLRKKSLGHYDLPTNRVSDLLLVTCDLDNPVLNN